MFLSQAHLNTASPDVARDLEDVGAFLSTLMGAFPTPVPAAREAQGILYRVDVSREGPPVMLLQSAVAPDFTRLPAEYTTNTATRALDEERLAIAAGDRYQFRMRANATTTLPDGGAGINKGLPQAAEAGGAARETGVPSEPRGPREPRGHVHRVALHGEALLVWLKDQAARGGFELEGAHVVQESSRRGIGGAGGKQTLTFASALFEGFLVVTDAERFRQTLATGVGRGKAYGFGLLSIRRA